MVRCLVALAIVFSCLAVASANTNDPLPGSVPPHGPQDYVLPAVVPGTAPKIDGKIELSEWPENARGEGFFDEGTGVPSDERAEFWLASDSKFIYFAARVYTDPKTIVADEYRQGVDLRGNDSMTLGLDVFGTGNSANTFGINASGATSIELAGGRAAKTEWLGEFEGRGRKTETGWECEARIPWALMSLPSAGIRDLKMNVWWFRTSKSGTFEWKYAKNDLRNLAVWKGVNVPAIGVDRSIKLLPYTYLGVNENGGLISNTGVDVKTQLNDQLQLVGTLNPDFRSIENNILSLDFSYFERLAADARPFFQEGAQYYNTGFDQRLFASQRIEDFDLGLNVYGNLNAGQTRFGLMSITDVHHDQAAVLSIGQKVAPNYDLGFAYVGNRHPGEDNDALQMTNSYKVGDHTYYVNSQFTSDEQRKSGHRLNLGWFTNAGGVNGSFEYVQISPSFFPRLGFSPEQNLKGWNGNLYQEWAFKNNPVQTANYNISGVYYNRFDGGFYRDSADFSFNAGLRNKLAFGGSASVSNFEGSADRLFTAGVLYPFTDPYRNVRVLLTDGEFGGEHFKSTSVSLQYRPLKRMQLSLASQFVEFHGFSRQIIGSMRFDMGRFESVGGRVVNRDNKWNAYAFYRLSGRRGCEYFLIFGDPNSESFSKQLILKVVVPMTIRF